MNKTLKFDLTHSEKNIIYLSDEEPESGDEERKKMKQKLQLNMDMEQDGNKIQEEVR